MKQLTFSVLLNLFFAFSITAQTADWGWAKNGGGGAADYAYGTATDVSGNVYYCGTFYSSNGTFGTTTFTSGGLGDGFICKYDAVGNFLWARQITGGDVDVCEKIVVNSNGDVFVTGFSEGDFSAEGNFFSGYGEDDGFVAKYNNLGTLQWIRHFGGEGEDYPYAVTVDNNGRCIVTGTFEHTMNIAGTTLTAHNDSLYSGFIAKFDKKGNLLWAETAGGDVNSSYVLPSDVAVDANGSIFLCGTYNGEVDFGTKTLNSTDEAFIAKMSSGGTFQWAVNGGSHCYYSYIALDAASNIFITGSYGAYGYETEIGDFTLTTNGPYMDIYTAKFNSAGIAQSVQTGGSSKNDYAGGIDIDDAGNVWITGYIRGGTADFGSQSFTSSGKDDVYVVSYDASGNLNSLLKAGHTGDDHAFDLALNGNDEVFIAGSFKSKLTLGSITLNASTTSADAFLGRIDVGGERLDENNFEEEESVEIYPNPASDFIMIKSRKPIDEIKVFDATGKQVSTTVTVNTDYDYRINSASLPPGTYWLQLRAGERPVSRSIIIAE